MCTSVVTIRYQNYMTHNFKNYANPASTYTSKLSGASERSSNALSKSLIYLNYHTTLDHLQPFAEALDVLLGLHPERGDGRGARVGRRRGRRRRQVAGVARRGVAQEPCGGGGVSQAGSFIRFVYLLVILTKDCESSYILRQQPFLCRESTHILVDFLTLISVCCL